MKKNLLFIISIFVGIFGKSQVIYNAYAKVTAMSASSFTLSNVDETNHTFVNGEQVLIMQMQDNVIGTNTTNATTFGNLGSIQRAGLWEVKTIASQVRVSSVLQSITFSGALVNTYNVGVNSSLQIVTFRNLGASFTTTASIVPLSWDGNIGGVVAVQVTNNFNLRHHISANAAGFRRGLLSTDDGSGCNGGTVYFSNYLGYGGKAEGIYKNTDPNFLTAQGKMLNGGGGGTFHNGAGGGGGNYTAGGQGGPGWDGSTTGCSPGSGGLGGISLAAQIVTNRIFMGGGGGGAQQNNSVGSPGGNGGGIIVLKANQLQTNATCTLGAPNITANGESAAGTSGGFNDAAGGGGVAGTIVLQINSYNINSGCPVTVAANGGSGGSSPFGTTHAGGGAGAQGVVAYTTPQPTVNMITTTNNGTPGCNDNSFPCTNLGGAATGINNAGILTNIGGVLPVELLNFSASDRETNVALAWATATEKNTDYFLVERTLNTINWMTVARSKAGENSQNTLYYEATDDEPAYGISYYRLKIFNLDGSFSYSKLETINLTKSEEFVIFYPNPSSGIVNLATSHLTSEISYKVYDVTGKLLLVGIKEKSDNKIIFDFSAFSKGLYFFNVSGPNSIEYKSNKIIIK
jgi:hypothetical protein